MFCPLKNDTRAAIAGLILPTSATLWFESLLQLKNVYPMKQSPNHMRLSYLYIRLQNVMTLFLNVHRMIWVSAWLDSWLLRRRTGTTRRLALFAGPRGRKLQWLGALLTPLLIHDSFFFCPAQLDPGNSDGNVIVCVWLNILFAGCGDTQSGRQIRALVYQYICISK